MSMQDLMRQGYRTSQTGENPEDLGATAGPEQALKPASRPAYGNTGTQRAAQSAGQVPSFEELLARMQPAELANSSAKPPAGQPTGQPSTNPESIPVLSGIGDALDFMSKIGLAPAYLGKYRDPNTGIIYTSDKGVRNPLTDMFPELSFLNVGGNLAAARDLESKYGIGAAEQMRQVFDFKTAADAASEAMSPDARGTARAVETAIPLAVGSVVRPPNMFQMMHSLANGETFLQSLSQTPGVQEDGIRKIRNAYAMGAAGEPSALRNIVGEAVLNPSNIVLGAVPIVKLGKLGISGLQNLPIVGPAVQIAGSKATAGGAKVSDLLWDSWLGKHTDYAIAAQRSGDVKDAISGYLGVKGIHELTTPEIFKAIREFRDTPLSDLPISYYAANTPIDFGQSQTLLQKYSTPLSKHGNPPKDPVKLAAWEARRKAATPVEDVLQGYERDFARDPNSVPQGKILDDLEAAIRRGELAGIRSNRKPAGLFETLATKYEQGLAEFGSWWKPLTLATRPAWFAGNEGTTAIMAFQRHGAYWNSYDEYSRLAAAEGVIPKRAGSSIYSPLADTQTSATQYLQGGFAPGASEQSIPGWLARIPLLGSYLPKAMAFGNRQERALHERGFNVEFGKILPVETQRIFAEAPLSEQGRGIVQGVVGAAQLERRLRGIQSGSVDIRDWIDYTGMSHRTAERLEQALDDIAKKQGGILGEKSLEQAYARAKEMTAANGAAMRADMRGLELHGATDAKDSLTAAGMSVDDNARKAVFEHGNSLEAQFRKQQADSLAFFNHMLTSKQGALANTGNVSGLKAEGTRLMDIERVLQGHLGKMQDEFIDLHAKDRNKAWADTYAMRDSHAAGTIDDTEKARRGFEIWDGYTEQWRALMDSQHRRIDNLMALAHEGMYRNWSPSRLQAEYKKLAGNWVSDTTVRAVPDDVLKAWNEALATPTGHVADDAFEQAAQQVGIDPSMMPGRAPDWVKIAESDVTKDLAELDASLAAFKKNQFRYRYFTPKSMGYTFDSPRNPPEVEALSQQLRGLPSERTLADDLGMDPEDLVNRVRQASMIARDKADRAVREWQTDYVRDRRNIDRVLNMAGFPFAFWQSRYMLFQIKQAAKNPQQAYGMLRVFKSWWDANEDRPWYDRFSIHTATLDAGTPTEMEVRFNPTNMLVPLGMTAGEVIRAADNDQAGAVTQGFELVSNLVGGALYPWMPVLAAQLGQKIEGGPPKDFGDMMKTLVPPITWGRQAAAAALGPNAAGLAMLTQQETDGVIRAMAQDASAGLLNQTIAKRAAASLKDGNPDPTALQYLEKTAPGRFGGSMVRAAVNLQGQQLPQQVQGLAWEALRNAKTEADRQAVYQAFPGLQVNLAGKRGDELELALIHSKAPVVPEIRSMYYRQHSDRIGYLTGEIDKKKGTDPADWKLASATPESFEQFRLQGGSAVVPALAAHWLDGKPIPADLKPKLYELYNKQGMGALTYEHWLEQVLPDAYRQWTFQNAEQLRRGR